MQSYARRSSSFIAAADEDAEADFFCSSFVYAASPFHLSHSTTPVSSLRGFNSLMYDARLVGRQPRFLQTCACCGKPIGGHMDIFMYRGDTPFCSEECRQEQIDIDEAKEKKLKTSSSVKPSPSANKAEKYPIRTGTVAAA